MDNEESFDRLVAELRKIVSNLAEMEYGDPDSLDADTLREDLTNIVDEYEEECGGY